MVSEPEWLGALRELVAAMEASDATDIEVSVPGLRVLIRRFAVGFDGESTAARPPRVGAFHANDSRLHEIRSPLTGVWYDAPSPGAPPFVEVGHLLEVGTVVGLVETMKIFNEVVSDARGVVRALRASSGELVAEGAVLFDIDLPPASDQGDIE
jgi:acetyl-CoA carboxylase biotin carboxyl carrier protein